MNELDLEYLENFRKENSIELGKAKENGFIGYLDTEEEKELTS